MTRGDPPLLVVEDEPLVADSLVRALRAVREVTLLHSVGDASAALESGRQWAAAILDVGLPDGSGLEVLRLARQLYPLLPVLVLTARDDVETINETHRLRAEFACKPFDLHQVVRFAKDALAFENVSEERVLEAADALAKDCNLTPREVMIVKATLTHKSRSEVLTELGVTENTLKSHVRSVLRKTGHDSMQSLTRALLRDALRK
jgi:DNA-binding NarL/FixJ family response regulator